MYSDPEIYTQDSTIRVRDIDQYTQLILMRKNIFAYSPFTPEKEENPYLVWGDEAPLAGEHISLVGILETFTQGCTEFGYMTEVEFMPTLGMPWSMRIFKIYPPLQYGKSEEERKEIENLVQMKYDQIPAQYFAEEWIGDKEKMKNYSIFASDIVRLYATGLIALDNIQTGLFTFAPEIGTT